MQTFRRRLQAAWLLAMLGGVALTACGGEAPSSPSSATGETVQPHQTVEAAASSTVLTVDPRRVRLQCSQGFPCGMQLVVTSSALVTLHYSLNGDFLINIGNTSCPQGGAFAGSCTIGLDVGTTQFPGRRSAILTISESTFGTSRTVRLSARVS